MFKSISYKIVAMFVLLTVSVIILIGTFMINKTESFYDEEFKNLMDNVFSDEYIGRLSAINGEDSFSQLVTNISAHSGQMGIDSFRNYFILDARNGKVLSGDLTQTVEMTPNVITAMNGSVGGEVDTHSKYMDYAVPVSLSDGGEYVVYVKDIKTETNSVVKNIFYIIFEALGLGLVLSFLFGILLSKTIISPISSLTAKAERMADGDFEDTIEAKSSDEIGMLTNSFNFMASELKDIMAELKNEKEKVENILLYMSDGVIAFGLDGKIMHINAAAVRMLGIDDTENANFDSIFAEVGLTITQMRFMEGVEPVEKEIVTKDMHLKASFASLKINEKLGGIVVVVQDVTKQQKLDNSRREFVANVSHELRTPITTIKSYTETMLFGIDDGEMDREMFKNFLGVIDNESDRMTTLIKDLLLLSKLDHDQAHAEQSEHDLAVIVKDIVSSLQITAKNKNQSLIYEPTNALPPFKCNRGRIEQVIVNIISNAIKYTPEGGNITVTTMHVYNNIYIKIKDTGIGIPKEDLPHVFERFYRVDKARSRKQGGTGLGLAIAKEIVEEYGGTINVNSEVNKGTEFVVSFNV